jgi:hypothetical protein
MHMPRSPKRFLVPLVLLAGIAACVINLNFDVAQTMPVNTPLPPQAQGQTLPPIQIDLSQSSEVQQHKSSIDSLALDSMDLAVLQFNPANNNVTSISGSIAFRADTAPADGSQDVALGAFTLSVNPVGTAHLQGNHAVDALVLNAVKGSGKLSVILKVTGVTPQSASNNADFALKTTLHMAMGYNTGIF